jgi:hypothetical protein
MNTPYLLAATEIKLEVDRAWGEFVDAHGRPEAEVNAAWDRYVAVCNKFFKNGTDGHCE